MLFKTTDDGEKIISFFNKAKIESENFTKQLEKDKIFLTEYFNATGNVAKQQAILNKFTNETSKNAIEYAINTKGAAGAVSDFEQQQLKANSSIKKSKNYFDLSTISANTYKLAIRGITLVANMATSALLSGVVYAFSKLFTAQNEAIKKARDLTSTYKSNSTSLEDYKEQINTLVTELNSSNISYEVSKTKRKELMSIQDELFKKYGTEEQVVKSITAAINGEVDALDTLSQKSYYEWLASVDSLTSTQKFGNEFFKIFTGISDQYKSALDSAVDYMEDKSQFFYVKISGNEELDNLIQEKFGLYKNTFDEFVIKDMVPEEAYEILGEIRTAYRDNATEYLGTETDNILATVNDSIQSAMTTIDAELGKHQETYHTYLEGMIKYDSEYSDEYADLLSKRELLEEAELSTDDKGKQQRIFDAKKDFYESLNNAIVSAENNDNVRRYFEDLYPYLYSEIPSWNFEYNISANTDGIADTAKEIGEKYAATDLLNMVNTEGVQEGEESFNSLIDKAIEYGICTDNSAKEVQKFIDLLVKLGIVQDNVKGDTFNDKYPISFLDIFSLKDAEGTLTNLGKISESIDTVQNAYKTLNDAIDEYNENGVFSIDTLQSVIALGDDWLDYLVDEEGNLTLDKESLEQLTQARLNDMRVQAITSIIDNVSKIKDDAKANDYLTSTNYALAESYETLAAAKLEDAEASMRDAVNAGTLSQENMDAAINKATADIDKINKLFANTSIDAYSIMGGGGSGGSSSKSKFSETIDFFERRVKVLDDALSHLKSSLDNVTGSFAKNNLIDAELDITEEKFNNYTDALAMYTQKANEAFSKIPADIASTVKDGAVSLTEFIGDSNEDVVEAIKEYESWTDKITDCTQELEELKTAIRQLELEKFNNIMDDFSNQFDLRGDSKDLISKQIDLLKESGELIGESFFTAQIDQSKKQLELLENEKAQLVNQLSSAINSGRIQAGTEEWLEMVNALSDVDGSILDCQKSIEEFDNSLLELHTEIFNRIQEQFSNLDSEISNILDLFDEFEVSDDKGIWSKEGIAQLGLLAQQYELAQYQVQQYNNEIDELNKQYLAGRYSATEYADKLADLSSAQWDAVKSTESAKDSIMDLNETRIENQIKGIEKEIEAYKELTDAQIGALKASKDLHDYENSIAEKTKSITDLERQITAMQNDTSAATIAKRKKLEEQLAEAKKDLEETEYDHSIEVQEDALNKQYENYEKERNEEIDALRESLNDKEAILAESFETVKENASVVGQEIATIATEHGITVSNALISSWQSGENAIASYGKVLSQSTSAFIQNIMGVENEVWNLQAQANTTADSLAWMFSAKADNLVNELYMSYYAETTLAEMTNALQQSLVNTLERGYDASGIVNSLNSIADAAERTKMTLYDLYNQDLPTTDVLGKKATPSYQGKNVNPSEQEKNKKATPNNSIGKYASGTRNAKEGLRVVNETGPELVLPKLPSGNYTVGNAGDQILTKVETDNIFGWAKLDPDNLIPINITDYMDNLRVMSMPQILPGNVNNNNNPVQIGNLINVQGSVNSSDLKQMESIANKAVDKLVNKIHDGIMYGT